MTKGPNSIRRSVGKIECTITWPIEWNDFDTLPRHVRNAIREHIDAANDLIERFAP